MRLCEKFDAFIKAETVATGEENLIGIVEPTNPIPTEHAILPERTLITTGTGKSFIKIAN